MTESSSAIIVGCSVGFILTMVVTLAYTLLRRHRRKVSLDPLRGSAPVCRKSYGTYCNSAESPSTPQTPVTESMEYLMFQPSGFPCYTKTDRTAFSSGADTGTRHNTLLSQSEMSSFTSDDECQGQSKRKDTPRIDLLLTYKPFQRSLHVQIEHVTLRNHHRPPFMIRCSAFGRRQQVALTFVGSKIDVATSAVQFDAVESSWLLQGRLSCQLFGRAGSLLAERLLAEGSVRLSQMELAKRATACCRLILHRPSRGIYIPLQFHHQHQPDEIVSGNNDDVEAASRAAQPHTREQSATVDSDKVRLTTTLNYQSTSSQLCLFAASIDGLASKTTLMNSGFSVRVVLVDNGCAQMARESHRLSRKCCQLNQEFTFNITRAQMVTCWLRCELVAARWYGARRCVGLCQIGADTTGAGQLQWSDCVAGRTPAPTVQHTLLPPH